MAAHFYKHKILLDENTFVRSFFPRLNRIFTVKHIAQDLKHDGFTDQEVVQFAAKNQMIVVTFNIKDFVKLIEVDSDTGVVGVSTNLSEENMDKKLTALFRKSTHNSLLGKVTMITADR